MLLMGEGVYKDIKRLKVLLKYFYIWLFQQFEQDLRDHVESTLEMSMPLLTEVSEVTRRVTLKGDRVEVVGKWLLDLGFWTMKFYENKYIYTHLSEYVCLVRISWSGRTIISMVYDIPNGKILRLLHLACWWPLNVSVFSWSRTFLECTFT